MKKVESHSMVVLLLATAHRASCFFSRYCALCSLVIVEKTRASFSTSDPNIFRNCNLRCFCAVQRLRYPHRCSVLYDLCLYIELLFCIHRSPLTLSASPEAVYSSPSLQTSDIQMFVTCQKAKAPLYLEHYKQLIPPLKIQNFSHVFFEVKMIPRSR